jgi:hypothetical protein
MMKGMRLGDEQESLDNDLEVNGLKYVAGNDNRARPGFK